MNIPNTVTSIGEWAFRICRNLTSIELPNSITNIENPEHQFDGCDKLTTIYGTAGSYAETFAKKYGYQFISNTSTQKFDIQDGTLVKYTGTAKNVVIPEGVTKIGAHAFENCTQVRTVHIPDGVTAIEDYAFSGCNNLTTINIPNSVVKLGEFAFYLCFDLNNLSIPESVTEIGMYTFTYCESLTDIIIPSQITMLKEGVFAFCRNLVNVNLPEIVEQIDNGAFRYCTSLTDITIPKQVTVIHQDAFDECRNLQTIYGYGGSCAELFAGSIGYLFVDLNQPFTDVISREWFYDAVVFAYQRGIMTGMDETTFGPSVSMARDHIVTMLYRLEGEPEVAYEPVFPDVPENDFYTDAVMWGNQVGIATGYENG